MVANYFILIMILLSIPLLGILFSYIRICRIQKKQICIQEKQIEIQAYINMLLHEELDKIHQHTDGKSDNG